MARGRAGGEISFSPDSDAIDTAHAVRAGAVSATEAVEAAIRRVEDGDRRLSYLVSERFEAAVAEAEVVDDALPLAGVPILSKDFFTNVAGLALTEGSAFIPGWVPGEDSEYVRRLKRAGAIILGSTTAPEFALHSSCEPRRYGPTLNPVAPGLTTGGSSGGSAAAVASGGVPVALGSDVGGSIRMPAACCGLIGLKPTRGRNPLGPDHGDLEGGCFAEHVLSRSVRDSAAFLAATCGAAAGDPYQAPESPVPFMDAVTRAPGKLRIGVGLELPDGRPLDADSLAAMTRATGLLEELGHEVEVRRPTFDLPGTDAAYVGVFSAGLAARVAMWSRRLGRDPEPSELEPYTLHVLARGQHVTGPELVQMIQKMQRGAREIATLFDDIDVWVTPTLGFPPYPLGYLVPGPDLAVGDIWHRDGLFGAFCWLANITGQPALTYPVHRTEGGTPIGIQLTGRFGRDDVLFGLAAEFERHLGPVSIS